jgi:hypothetical protein
MLAFANAHGAHEVPVVFTGDFNANDCDELAGIARMIVRLLHSPTHPLLWSIRDAPTGPTSITDERNSRIDYVLYQSDRIKLTGSGPPPARGMTTIPNLEHPSDHLPVSSRMKLKSKWDKMEEDARQWLACVSGTTACRPLSGVAVRNAFEYFDKDHAALISPLQLEAGLQQLGFPGLNTNFILDALREAGCRPHPGEHEDTWAMDVEQFVQVRAAPAPSPSHPHTWSSSCRACAVAWIDIAVCAAVAVAHASHRDVPLPARCASVLCCVPLRGVRALCCVVGIRSTCTRSGEVAR